MKINIRTKDTFSTSQWSGGDTTQLYIYPENGNYAAREFKARISSATVDLDKSEFTPLAGVERRLLILQGEMKLCHEGHYERQMQPYEVETFMGDWNTTSYGRVVDFNFMVKDGAKGDTVVHTLKAGETCSLALCSDQWDKTFLYCAEGDVQVEGETLFKGDLAVLEEYGQEECRIQNTGSEVIRTIQCSLKL